MPAGCKSSTIILRKRIQTVHLHAYILRGGAVAVPKKHPIGNIFSRMLENPSKSPLDICRFSALVDKTSFFRDTSVTIYCGVEQWQLVGLITQRSQVRVLPPLLQKGLTQCVGLFYCKQAPSLFESLGAIKKDISECNEERPFCSKYLLSGPRVRQEADEQSCPVMQGEFFLVSIPLRSAFLDSSNQ